MCRKKHIVILIIFLIPIISFSKDKLKKYTKGYYVTYQNDTVRGYLKNLSLSASCERIKFKKDNDTRPTELYPEDVKMYKRGYNVYVSKYLGESSFTTGAFLIPIIKGELSMYSRWVKRNHSSPNHVGSYSTDVNLKYIQLKGKPILRVKKINFRKKISKYLSDNHALSERISKKEIKSINEIVREYNRWHKSGRENE